MYTLTCIILVALTVQKVFGQDVTITLDKTCYGGTGEKMTITASYSGSFTINGVIWSYSGRHMQDTIVDTSCSLFQSDTGFPYDRITFVCPPNTSNSNIYQLILSSLVTSDFKKTWSATFQVSDPSNPNFQTVLPKLCEEETTDTNAGAITGGSIGGLCVFLVGVGVIVCVCIVVKEKAIWYVCITNEETLRYPDKTWSLGASVGAFCVTKVTPGGPADGQLKVGYQIHDINGTTVTEENQTDILGNIQDKSNLTLRVSRVGSMDKSSVVFNNMKGELLGFEFDNLAIVTNVTRGSKAAGKLKKGDYIISINGKSTAGQSYAKVNTWLRQPHEVLELSIRGNPNRTIDFDLRGKSSSGIKIAKEKKCILVSGIEPQSAAAISKEVKVGDCILSVNGVSTANLKVADIKKMLTSSSSIVLKVTGDVSVIEQVYEPGFKNGEPQHRQTVHEPDAIIMDRTEREAQFSKRKKSISSQEIELRTWPTINNANYQI